MAFGRSEEFDWHDDDSVVIRRQPAIAVYENPYGQAVIRQEALDYDPDDRIVLLSPENIPAVIKALQEIMAQLGPQPERLALPAPARSAAAERQARYRDRQRNGRDVGVGIVTGDVTHKGERDAKQGSLLDE